MSTPLHKKIKKIRESEKMSRAEFGEKIGVSKRSLEGIENEGRNPGGNVLEKIADAFPQYIFYLLTSKKSVPVRQKKPGEESVREWKIIQRLEADNEAKLLKCVVKPEWFSKLIFLQDKENTYNLSSILIVKNGEEENGICVEIVYGNMNFETTGGKNSLRRLRDWLQKDRPDLIKTAQIFSVEAKFMENLYKSLVVSEEDMQENTCIRTQGYLMDWITGEESQDNFF